MSTYGNIGQPVPDITDQLVGLQELFDEGKIDKNTLIRKQELLKYNRMMSIVDSNGGKTPSMKKYKRGSLDQEKLKAKDAMLKKFAEDLDNREVTVSSEPDTGQGSQ